MSTDNRGLSSSLLIDSRELQLLLEKNRDKIGHTHHDGKGELVSGILFIASILPAVYPSIYVLSSSSVKKVCLALGFAVCAGGLAMLVKSHKNLYGHKKLYSDIEKLNTVQHRHSLVAIKDTFSSTPSRFLLYYDDRWDCWFFFNYKTTNNDQLHVTQRLAEELHIPTENLTLTRCGDRIQTKYSVSAKEEKTYNHTLYSASLKTFPEPLTHPSFSIDNRKYKWMSMREMHDNPMIQEKNKDVVNFVDEIIH